MQRLAKQKKVPKTFAVPCHVVDPAAATTETSLAENIIRVAMHPADQFIAFHDLVVQSGLGIDEVPARFGVSPLFDQQRLKLANVAPRSNYWIFLAKRNVAWKIWLARPISQ